MVSGTRILPPLWKCPFKDAIPFQQATALFSDTRRKHTSLVGQEHTHGFKQTREALRQAL